MADVETRAFDYIVVGSGAGGGPLAANLARAGYTVALLEAGVDPLVNLTDDSRFNYTVPAFHAQAVKDSATCWDFMVQRDAYPTGVRYPRALAFGGCTVLNAMITVCPMLSILKHSGSTEIGSPPDLCIFGVPGFFKGFCPEDGNPTLDRSGIFIWTIVRVQTSDRAGSVKLGSAEPLHLPIIDYRFFDRTNRDSERDGNAIVEGVNFIQDVMRRSGNSTELELLPGTTITENPITSEVVRNSILSQTLGRSACGTCRMSRKTENRLAPLDDQNAVVDSEFRVYGVQGLRVVDASVFPRPPGFFIASAVYMISEKASDIIVRDARRT